jgi:hypothetical protein
MLFIKEKEKKIKFMFAHNRNHKLEGISSSSFEVQDQRSGFTIF